MAMIIAHVNYSHFYTNIYTLKVYKIWYCQIQITKTIVWERLWNLRENLWKLVTLPPSVSNSGVGKDTTSRTGIPGVDTV